MTQRRRALTGLLAAAVVASGLGLVAVVADPLGRVLGDVTGLAAQDDTEGQRVVDLQSVFTDLSGVGGLTYFDYRYGEEFVADPFDPAAGSSFLRAAQDETTTESCRTRTRAVVEARARTVVADFATLDVPRPAPPAPADPSDPFGTTPTTATAEAQAVLGEAAVVRVYAGVLDEELQQSPEFEPAWLGCVAGFREEGTVPVAMTVAGRTAFAFTSIATAPPGTPQVDAITWLEPGLEIWVMGARIIEGDAADLLQQRANPVEPALEVAEAIMSRNFDETRVLLDDAFTPPSGVVYSQPVPGTEDRVRTAFRQGLEAATLDLVLQQLSEEAAAGLQAPETPEILEEDPTLLILNAEERLVEQGAGGDARVQAVVWDPAFLNTRAFRVSWRRGLEQSVDAPEDVRFSEHLDVREYAVTTSEGRSEVHWIGDCFTVKVAATDEDDALGLADAVITAQAEAAEETFGVAPSLDDTRKGERRRDRRNAQRCARPRLAELRSSVQVVPPDAATQRQLLRALDAALERHDDEGAFPADPDLLEIEEPTIDFRSGVAEVTAEVQPVFVLLGAGGDAICLSARSPSDTPFMVKEVRSGDEAVDGRSFAEGAELPQRCTADRLQPRWSPVRPLD